ncbi:hypothetical protein LNP04_12310 [Chryseobacterium sp. C-71]|uniref:hypothetical protein n=1 Tax=Chryseobacterium sp. C-71 TaxID=2893882 RepID=UPI001E5E5FF0|nr:hypothetical protein [Chryseobacterium sp. C-71]UFH30758.1 hypothetical protein LNP04_12310 [Chryseobacterium sp. C-71]
MPQNTIQSSTPTSSDGNGLNVRPDLLPESYLFIEKKAFTQAQTDKFGMTGDTTFRTTSRISYTGKIFTICQGQVLIQPNSDDPTKVNLILKPFTQPIKGLAIKYFIYRGLKASDFFGTNQTINPISNATGFVKHIRDDFQKLYNMLNLTEPTLTAQYIGYPGTGPYEQATNLLIDDFFFKISQEDAGSAPADQKAFELPMIPRGTHLGTIDPNNSFGIDIVLNEGDYTIENDPNPFKLDLNFARLNNHILNSTSGANAFENKLIRESATQFIDIAAFYGLHTHGKGKLHASNNGQDTVLQTNDEIYSAIEGFATAKTTYLYILGSRQRSYNFYNNHPIGTTTNDYKKGTTTANLVAGKFSEYWPLQEFTDTPSLAIQLTTDSNDAAALYVKQGILNVNTANEDYFIRGENLLQQADANNTVDTELTKPIVFDVKKTSTGTNIGSFVQLIYEGKALEITNVVPPLSSGESLFLKDIDDVFGLINVTPHIQPKSTNELRYVIDQNLLLIDFENKTGGKDIATVTTKRVEDQIMKNDTESVKRVTHETLLNNIRQSVGGFFESRSAYQDNSNSGFINYDNERNNFYQPEKPYYFKTISLTNILNETITALTLDNEKGTIASKKILGITEEENLQILNIIDQYNLNNPKFYLNEEMSNGSNIKVAPEKISYKMYSLSVIGENITGEIKIVIPSQKIYIITIDDLVFTSNDYAKWNPRIFNTQKLTPSFFINESSDFIR